jgi:hypothetical protein
MPAITSFGDEYELAHGGDRIGGRAVPLTAAGVSWFDWISTRAR